MFNRILHIILFLALATTAGAQYLPGKLQGGSGVPGTQSRSPLNSLERAANNLAGATILTDTFGNQRLALFVHIEDTCIHYTPAATGNTQNLSAFVEKCSTDSVWYIDWEGKSQFIGGAGAVCDQDWLQISDNSCPDAITDSIYHYRYAAIGARLVWPTAEFLVSDSSAVQVTVLSGNRNSRLAFYDNVNQVSSTIDQSAAQTIWYIEPTGEMRWTTAGGGTPQAPGAPFVNQFAINPAASPLPTIQAHQYPNTRNDTFTVRNFLYTDINGNHRSRPIDSLVVIVVDSIQADTTLLRNWYNSNDTTTALGRVAFVLRTAWWRTLDSLGFYRFTNRPDNFDGSQFTIYQDSITLDADTIIWKSSWHPALQYQEFQAEGTYFHFDSTQVAGWGQFPDFPNFNENGTEKGILIDNTNNQSIYVTYGDGTTGAFSYYLASGGLARIATQADNLFSSTSDLFNTSNPSEGRIRTIVNQINSIYTNQSVSTYINENDANFYILNTSSDIETAPMFAFIFGQSDRALNETYEMNGIGMAIRQTFQSDTPFDWIRIGIDLDSIGDSISFYNRAYYFRNEHPIGAAGDTLFHFWAATGPGGEAGQDPGFMTLDQVCAHCAADTVNIYTADGTTTDNTRIATIIETITFLSDDVTFDGVVPFRFELSGGGANEPENMVWMFPNGDSSVIRQGDQEILLSTNSAWVLRADLAASVQADSFSFNPNLGGNAFRVGQYNVFTQNSDASSGISHRDAIEYRSITGVAQTELFLDGSSAVWVIPTNSNTNFKVHVAAICSAAGNGVGINAGDSWDSWHLGGIKRIGSTTALVGSVQADATAQSDAGMSTSVVTIDADDGDDSLRIRFTPPSTAGTTTVIQVTATIETTQTSY